VNYYLDELRRRETARVIEASNRLARRAYWLSVINGALAFVSAAAAVIAIVLSA
jgi:hypothetical protein